MRCPACGFPESKVIDSRPTDDNKSIRRRRECLSETCQKRFTTYETIDMTSLIVIKKDGTRQSFDKNKIYNSIVKACDKRVVTQKTMQRIADEIEMQLQNSLASEISSTEIGGMVMEKLKAVDEVAYVRFASVYREFKDINTFMDELRDMMNKRG